MICGERESYQDFFARANISLGNIKPLEVAVSVMHDFSGFLKIQFCTIKKCLQFPNPLISPLLHNTKIR